MRTQIGFENFNVIIIVTIRAVTYFLCNYYVSAIIIIIAGVGKKAKKIMLITTVNVNEIKYSKRKV